jgi:predicted transcriptional regulator
MSEIKLTEKDKLILEVIKSTCGAIGPTEIGVKLGRSYNSVSSYCSGSLKKLMNAGLIVKITTDRVKYKLKRP